MMGAVRIRITHGSLNSALSSRLMIQRIAMTLIRYTKKETAA